MAEKTALNKEPTTKPAPKQDAKLPETTKRGSWKYRGKWVNKEGFLVDNYGQVLPDQKQAFVPAKSNPFVTAPTTPTTPDGKKRLTGQEIISKRDEAIARELGRQIPDYLRQTAEFDPRTFQQEYEPQYEQGMQRAYDTIYNEFNRRNEEVFAKQNQDLQQSLVERGLDPNSPAYQALTKQLAQQQSDARQAAQSQAWQAAQGYQQQGYQQAVGTAMLPGQIMEPSLALYGAQYKQRGAEELQRQQAEYARQLQELEGQQRLQQIRAGRGGGGGGMGPFDQYMAQQIMQGYAPQGPSVSAGNAAAQGFATGIGAGMTNYLTRG